jgi:hypothetical protein
MFDLPLSNYPTAHARGFAPPFLSGATESSHPFALTLSRRAPADLMSGRAVPLVLARFATLAEAMQGAIHHAKGMAQDTAPQLLAILDLDERLVLGGAASNHAVAWCHPVTSAADWGEPDLAVRLRHRADLLDARLVDPFWRTFAARALQVAA